MEKSNTKLYKCGFFEKFNIPLLITLLVFFIFDGVCVDTYQITLEF